MINFLVLFIILEDLQIFKICILKINTLNIIINIYYILFLNQLSSSFFYLLSCEKELIKEISVV